MRTSSSYSDYQPLGHFGRVPVYAASILALFYAVGMIVATMLASAGVPLGGLYLSADAFFGRGWVWQPLTCTFLNGPSFFFLFGIFFFYMAAVEVERYLGRSRFLKFYALTLLVPVAVLGLWRLAGFPALFGGLSEITVAMFIAFATLYPNIEYLGWVPLKYVAFACFAIASLGFFPQHDWVGLSVLTGESVLAFFFVRHLQRGGGVEWGEWFSRLNPFKRRPHLRVMPPPGEAGREDAAPDGSDEMEAINPVLEKIAKSGMASLTKRERAHLERAREALLKKERQ